MSVDGSGRNNERVCRTKYFRTLKSDLMGQRRAFLGDHGRIMARTFSSPNSLVPADDTAAARGLPPCAVLVRLVGFCCPAPNEIHFVIAMCFGGGPRGRGIGSMKG